MRLLWRGWPTQYEHTRLSLQERKPFKKQTIKPLSYQLHRAQRSATYEYYLSEIIIQNLTLSNIAVVYDCTTIMTQTADFPRKVRPGIVNGQTVLESLILTCSLLDWCLEHSSMLRWEPLWKIATHRNILRIFELQVKLEKISGVNLLTSSLKSCNVLEHVLTPATQALPETLRVEELPYLKRGKVRLEIKMTTRTCKAPLRLNSATHWKSREISSMTCSTRLNITRDTKELQMAYTCKT